MQYDFHSLPETFSYFFYNCIFSEILKILKNYKLYRYNPGDDADTIHSDNKYIKSPEICNRKTYKVKYFSFVTYLRVKKYNYFFEGTEML